VEEILQDWYARCSPGRPSSLTTSLSPVFEMEGIRGAKTPYALHSFDEPDSIGDCKIMSDRDNGGGFSTSHLDWMPPDEDAAVKVATNTIMPSSSKPGIATIPKPPSGYARWHGSISLKLPEDKLEIMRTGYAGWRTRDRPPTLFGRGIWDIDPYVYLAMRIKSDGRSYFVNVQTESIEPTDLHQHRLFVKRPGEWETVLIKWNDFVRTNHGMMVEPQTGMLRQRVKSIGISLTDRVPGPFEVCIERIWATNDSTEADDIAESKFKQGELKNKHGQRITWGNKD
jgi:NADH dehydrogenase [ubiquinone] 1 alpha subcomplex assembly factor 1